MIISRSTPEIKYFLFDAADTLVHKPELWMAWKHALEINGIHVSLDILRFHHKILSEVIVFPDQTSEDFYYGFNRSLLLSMGIIPNNKLLKDVFSYCKNLPWEPFEDTSVLKIIGQRAGILSNFNSGIRAKISSIFPGQFKDFFISEELDIRKPDVRIFELVLKKIELKPENILFVGDSLNLDIEPAIKLGINACLIDRNGYFKSYENRIDTLLNLKKYLT